MRARACLDAQATLAGSDDGRAFDAATAAHLATCPDCRALADDLAAIHLAARSLPELSPPPVVWARVAPAIGAASAGSHRIAVTPAWLAAAAALLLAVGAALGSLTRGGAPAAAPESGVAQVAADLAAADAHYQRAIAGLEQIARSGDASLDPAVAAVLRANLLALDGAIGDTRAALAREPDDDVARRGFLDALDGKVALLEETVALIDAERALDDHQPDLRDR